MFHCNVLMNVAGCSRCQCFNYSPPTYAALHSLLYAEVNICPATLKYRKVFRAVMLSRNAWKASPFLNQHKILCRSVLAQILAVFNSPCSCLFFLLLFVCTKIQTELMFLPYADSNTLLLMYSLVYLRAAMKDEHLKYILDSNRDTLHPSFKPFSLVRFSAAFFSPGPPGPPGVVIVEEITDTTATLSWTRGLDNHSPISTYNLQARSPFSLGWQTVKTGNQ